MITRKIIFNIISGLVGLPFLLFARDRRLWVFSGFSDQYSDSPKYLYEYISNYDNSIEAVWITSNIEVYKKLRTNGFRVEKRKSFKALFTMFRAQVFVYASYPSDLNTVASIKGTKVNLWHGFPFKLIERDIGIGPLSWIYKDSNWFEYIISRICHPEKKIAPNIMFAVSELEASRFSSAFNCKNIFVTPSLRRCSSLQNYTHLVKGEQQIRVLYAPTWRSDNLDNYYMHLNKTISALSNMLLSLNPQIILDVRLHPIANYSKLVINQFRNVNVNDDCDINDQTLFYNCLITDYSSILQNFKELNVPYILYSNDLNEYLQNERGLYREEIEFFKKEMVLSEDALLEQLSYVIKNIESFNNTPNIDVENYNDTYVKIIQHIKRA